MLQSKNEEIDNCSQGTGRDQNLGSQRSNVYVANQIRFPSRLVRTVTTLITKTIGCIKIPTYVLVESVTYIER